MPEFNPIYVYYNIADIPKVLEPLGRIKGVDKLILNYFPFPYPHRIAHDFLIAHPQYTHYIGAAQDLIVEPWNFEMLKRDILKYDFPVYSGVCNVDHGKYKDKLAITSNLPSLNYYKRVYHWISKNRYPNMILQVPFTGGALYCVRRDINEKCHINKVRNWQTRDERPIWERRGGYANDLAFAHNLDEAKIPINVNTTNVMDHLRYEYESKVGKRNPLVKFIPKDSNEKLCPSMDIEKATQIIG